MNFELTSQGQVRRDQILELALHQARRQRRRRQTFRAGIICLALVGMGVALLRMPRSPQEPPKTLAAQDSDQPAPQSADRQGAGKMIIAQIETDPTITR